ncbi:DNA-protecting protein DprA [bacterium]|nr:MAG: DNA-protecting protein DprA [bacterium]
MSIPDREHPYFNAFNQIPQIGSVRFRKLMNFFPDLETAWRANISEYSQAGLEESVIQQILEARRNIDPDGEFEKLERAQTKLITYNDEAYPSQLKEIPNPPITLYVRGEILPQDEMAIAIVGTRKYTTYGSRVTQDLVTSLVRANLTIVSGLALGIDSLAHHTATQSQGRTLAILACGVDTVYPASNRMIAERILDGKGALISELPLGTPPLKHHFPHRNRIISGISLGTVIIEAAADSGSLITARHALEQNRQVFAVPGSIYNPGSVGPNNLLKMGAKPVTCASDILEDLNLGHLQEELVTREVLADNPEEEKILNLLGKEPLHVDSITKTTGLPASAVAATLTIMEMKGKVRNLGANQFVKCR